MTDKFLVTGATGETGRYTVQRLLENGHAVRAMVHKEDHRAEALRSKGAEVVVGDLFEHDDVIGATAGATAAYFCYPVRPGIIQTTAYFADAARRAGLKAVINMSQISARERFQKPCGARSLDRRADLRLVGRSHHPPQADLLLAMAALSVHTQDHRRAEHH